MSICLRRREFVAGIGGAAAWPLAARAQQSERRRRVGALMDTTETNPEGQARISAFRQALHRLGWTEDRNIRIDLRWGGGDFERTRAYAAELVALKPDVIFAYAVAQLAPLSRETKTIPIVFVGASAPVEEGYVASFAHPGGNITGFTQYEASMVGKWLELLKEISPSIIRVAVIVNPQTAVLRGTFYFRAFETAAASFGVEPITRFVRSTGDIETAIADLGQQSGSGLIVAPETFTTANRELIVTLAAQIRIPAIYGLRQFPMTAA
jgi:putative ABC transport system substrate-binding protein